MKTATQIGQYLDHDTIERRFGSKMAIETVANIYLEEMPGVVSRVKPLLESDLDLEQARMTAHSLKGSFSMLSARPIVEVAVKMGESAINQDENQVRELARKLLHRLDILTQILRDIVKSRV